MAAAGVRCCLAALLVMASTTGWPAGLDKKIDNLKPNRTWNETVGAWYRSPTPKSIAVVIAISNYGGGGFAPLPTGRDADKMVDFLLNDAGFDTIHVLTEELATKQRIDKLMTDEIPAEVGSNDRFLFYWSGHGAQRISRDGRPFGYLPLATSRSGEFSGMISMQELARWDNFLGARQSLFVLDACFSGLAGIEKKAPRDVRLEQLSQPAHHLLTAGTASEEAISDDLWGGSLFTDAFIRGAKGEAARNSGTVVDLFLLISFIQERVLFEKKARGWSKGLTPQFRFLQDGNGAFFFTPATLRDAPTPAPGGTNPAQSTAPKGDELNEGPQIGAREPWQPPAVRGLEPDEPSQSSAAPFLKYPFVGKWGLETKAGRSSADCDKVTPFTIFNDETIRTPVGVLQLDEIRQRGNQWILRGHEKKTGARWPRVVYKDITANSMTIKTVGRDATCNLRRVAN